VKPFAGGLLDGFIHRARRRAGDGSQVGKFCVWPRDSISTTVVEETIALTLMSTKDEMGMRG
jgi:hypothetical protein